VSIKSGVPLAADVFLATSNLNKHLFYCVDPIPVCVLLRRRAEHLRADVYIGILKKNVFFFVMRNKGKCLSHSGAPQ
jgi:hypothetical protein